jgi:ribonucleoside-diphosphate reductase alpha chain
MSATPDGQQSLSSLADFIWRTRYRARSGDGYEPSLLATWQRVASAAAAIDTDSSQWRARFLGELSNWRFLPGGRILAGAGLLGNRTLANCFVMGTIDDSVDGIFDALKEGALTLQQGGGIGYDFSTLRPRGTTARLSNATASGPVSFMQLFDQMSETLSAQSPRGGAMMATLRCDHPDIEEFINIKRDPDRLNHFNLSVLVSDAFLDAVARQAPWTLKFSDVVRTISAVELWNAICRAAADSAEPGVLFIDRINGANNLSYRENLTATNPCAEAPLPPYGACHLGSLDLPSFITQPFAENATVDSAALAETTRTAVRFLDNIIAICRYPLYRQANEAHATRRIGIGVTGLADAIAMLRLRYDSEAGRAAARQMLTVIRDHAYMASIELARERGPFPAYQAGPHLDRPFIRSLPAYVQDSLAKYGIRNSHLLAIAPAGTISLLADNVSSGIEPIFALASVREVRDGDGQLQRFNVSNHAYQHWRGMQCRQDRLPDYFAVSRDIDVDEQLAMLGALQPLVDGSISKTVTLPRNAAANDVAKVFLKAHSLALKGCAVYRLGSRDSPALHCLDIQCATE